MKNNKLEFSGLSRRHTAAVIRRRMTQKNHGNKKIYSRKNQNHEKTN